MKLNLYSAIEAIKGFQDDLKKNHGSIVLFSSVAAQKGFTNHTIIASAKAAIEGLTVYSCCRVCTEYSRQLYSPKFN
jgi:NAD(P)-dependent dehydrogenase (short-subunit alcohol dehydrogenase family)